MKTLSIPKYQYRLEISEKQYIANQTIGFGSTFVAPEYIYNCIYNMIISGKCWNSNIDRVNTFEIITEIIVPTKHGYTYKSYEKNI